MAKENIKKENWIGYLLHKNSKENSPIKTSRIQYTRSETQADTRSIRNILFQATSIFIITHKISNREPFLMLMKLHRFLYPFWSNGRFQFLLNYSLHPPVNLSDLKQHRENPQTPFRERWFRGGQFIVFIQDVPINTDLLVQQLPPTIQPAFIWQQQLTISCWIQLTL